MEEAEFRDMEIWDLKYISTSDEEDNDSSEEEEEEEEGEGEGEEKEGEETRIWRKSKGMENVPEIA